MVCDVPRVLGNGSEAHDRSIIYFSDDGACVAPHAYYAAKQVAVTRLYGGGYCFGSQCSGPRILLASNIPHRGIAG